MSLLRALIRTVVEVPIAVVKDALTLGGSAVDEEPATKHVYEEIIDELND